jgi:cysteine-rich repeat protein
MGYSAYINNSFAAGFITGNVWVGALIGETDSVNIDNSYWLNHSGDDASGCVGDNAGAACNSNVETDVSYFYDVSNAPIVNWSFPPWDAFCGSEGYPSLEWQSDCDVEDALWSGSGIQGDPYEVTSCAQLQNMSTELAAHFELTGDIDCSATSGWDSNKGFDPIGNSSDEFTGGLDGQGYAISNLFIDRSAEDDVGLFGYASGANITSVGLTNVDITGGEFTGGLVGDLYGSIVNNSYATGNVTGTAEYTGGLIGRSGTGSSVDNSYATGNVNGTLQVGGLVGFNVQSTINNSFATGDAYGTIYIGGLVGTNFNSAVIDNSYAIGNVTATNNDAGGLVGENYQSTINNSFATGYITSTSSNSGGLVGKITEPSFVNNSYWYNNTGDNASVCVGNDASHACNNNVQTSYSYFYDVGNEPIVNWSFPPWDAFCDDSGYPSLEWENISDTADCLSSGKASEIWNGLGTQGDPYEIGNCTQLQNMSTELAAYFELTGDVNCSATSGWNGGEGFEPIGNYSSNEFTGGLDGQGYAISNLFINRSTEHLVGLFSYANAEIVNVDLIDVSVSGNSNVGGLLGFSEKTSIINNVHVSGNVEASSVVGGLVGYYSSSIGNSSSSVTVVSTGDSVGGLVGTLKAEGTINNSYATGNVIGGNDSNSYNVGGLVGENAGAISNSYATGDINGDIGLGGLLGKSGWNSTIDNSYATGNVTGNIAIGGLVGIALQTIINNSYATGDAYGASSIGGLVGQNYNSAAKNDYDAIISNSYATGNVTATGDHAGGLVGQNYKSAIDNSYAIGNVAATGDDVGGLVGANDQATINNSFATGYIASAGSNIGGLVGQITENSSVNNSYWYNYTGDDASVCVGNNASYDCNDNAKTNESYFYDHSNAPIVNWSFPPWDVVCDDEGYPSLELQGLVVASCIGYVDVCGNGVVGSGEGCDDGNVVSGDGCSASCTVESSGGGASGGGASGGGASGGAGGAAATNVSVQDGEEFSPSEQEMGAGYEKQMLEKQRIRFTVDNDDHVLTVSGISPYWVNLTIQSEVKILTLSVGETQKVDVNDDGFYDLQIFLKGIDFPKADIVLTAIHEEVESQLFDITFNLEDFVISDSSELQSVLTFTSFGTVPTPVDLTFIILDESGNEMYREKGDITVTTEEVMRWNYENLALEEGKYVAILETLYNVDVFDEFRQDFEIKKTKSFNWMFVILAVLLVVVIFIVYIIRRKKK